LKKNGRKEGNFSEEIILVLKGLQKKDLISFFALQVA
jgi:hypothetical protein